MNGLSNEDMKKWMNKIEKVKGGTADLSRDEDLAIALMNLISLEEHFYFTAMKTGNKKYFAMLKSVSEIRKRSMEKIVTNPEGEEWCISKHLLAASMRLMEAGNKELRKEREKEAGSFFASSFDLFSLFFAINLGLAENMESKQENCEKAVNEGNLGKFSSLVKKLVDCCKEW